MRSLTERDDVSRRRILFREKKEMVVGPNKVFERNQGHRGGGGVGREEKISDDKT